MIVGSTSFYSSLNLARYRLWIRASAIVTIALGFGSACKALPGSDSAVDTGELSTIKDAGEKAWRGTLRLVSPNDWACVAWTISNVTVHNSVVDDIFKKQPKVTEGSQLIAIKSSHYFVDYSKDGTAKGQNLNGAWGDCPQFTVYKTGAHSQELEIRTNTFYKALAPDGNGSQMVGQHSSAVGCATAENGVVKVKACDSQDSNQRWLWDAGKNGGYGYIKLANDSSQCMDVNGGGAGVTQGQPIILHRCKPFVAGPGGLSNNQRFWLDESTR